MTSICYDIIIILNQNSKYGMIMEGIPGGPYENLEIQYFDREVYPKGY
jgi:hypothetical protein